MSERASERLPSSGYAALNALSLKTNPLDSLQQLTRRVRWKRWLTKLHRFAWLLAVTFLVLFLADTLLGMRTLSLRIASGVTLVLAVTLLAVDWRAAWLVRLDPIGLAQLLEKRYPELAERLVTLVQIQSEEIPSSFAPLLRAETEERLAAVDPKEACPLDRERKVWLRTLVFLVILFVGLSFVPAFVPFVQRFFGVWTTPLVPFTIEVVNGTGYALRGGSHTVQAKVQMLDDHEESPEKLELIGEDEIGIKTSMPMIATSAGQFVAVLENLRQPLRCRVKAGEIESESFGVSLIDSPLFGAKPVIVVTPPKYLAKNGPGKIIIGAAGEDKIEILRFSHMRFRLPLNRQPTNAVLHVYGPITSDGEKHLNATLPTRWERGLINGSVETIAAVPGKYQADLIMELEHGLSAKLPVGEWTVHDDGVPRFTQPLRLYGGGAALLSNREYRISSDDALKLQTVIEDDEGLDAIALEVRVNDQAPRLEKWLHGVGKKKLVIDDWLPLPSGLKETDRVQFRVHASDNRRLRKGELQSAANPGFLPTEDLLPHVTIAPRASAGENAWITLLVDRSVESFLKQQAQAQADEVRDEIDKIKKKLLSESEQVQQLQRTTHQQPALTPAQMKQAEKLRALNREISGDLLVAAQRFTANPDLAKLAEHFLDIAENEMMKSAQALQRFSDKDRPLAEAEKELQIAQDALLQARKKLDRMLEWNKLVAQDRLDQFQIEKLLKRQTDLAQQLEKLLADQPASEEDLAKQIEAIRQEQAKVAEQTEKLQEQSSLVQESMETPEQKRLKNLAQEAQQLAAEQRAMREERPEKLPAEIKDRLDKLAQRQADLAERVQPFAQKNQGPEVKSAVAAADALKKPDIDTAIERQKELENRLQEWTSKLVPGTNGNSLREQILQLAKKQQAIRGDLEKLVDDATDLDFNGLQKRLGKMTTQQKELSSAIAKLAITGSDERLRAMQKSAEKTTREAAEHLMLANAAGAPAAHKLMKKAQQELETLASLIPNALPADRQEIKHVALRAKVEQIDRFTDEQAKLRAETERLRADAQKAAGGAGKPSPAEKAQKLASELMELAQKGSSPETKEMAKESAQTLEQAKKAMEASKEAKAKGNADEAKAMDENAEKQLQLAFKQLDKLAQEQAMKNPNKTDPNTAESLKESGTQMRKAEGKLPAMPKDAQNAMMAAAKSLQQASKQAGKQSASKLPSAARNPAANDTNPTSSAYPRAMPKDGKLEMFQGKAWGELPGELKTQMLQDVRARFGEEYAELIRQYFDRLAETPSSGRKD
jgi:hypothetical protein